MANGWTEARRAKQAEAIRRWKPWERSTGPQTAAGKIRSAQNALTHGATTEQAKEDRRRVSALLRDAHDFLRKVRT
ncbi:hypothetical protein [Caballeronia sp. LZ001]|uniref:hypothetical protein n=1 Tax=Caballeronia sp. LZ001 TaxID=3038553 RepID=UPI0028651666|nr:hypothetical protein [Caballeronia sp. LZ001]MDR5801593.1 hypothetical protein [Caballeronia sp. LZ001]